MDLKQTAEEAVKKLEPYWKEEQIEVHQNIEGPLGVVRGQGTLADLFKNLLKHCYFILKQNKERKREVWIEAKREGIYTTVVIKDSGELDIIEARNSTLGAAGGGKLFTERGQRGGVNLYIAQSIAHDHEFVMRIGSDPGHGLGAVFEIKMPVKEQARETGT